jgi:RNA polymerase sigma factor (sigma-70 family)
MSPTLPSSEVSRPGRSGADPGTGSGPEVEAAPGGASSEDLLRRFAEGRSEGAFAELVRRHVNLVYGTALRCCAGDSGLAGDVTQRVFTDLASKAASVASGVVLAGWLHRHATFVASSAVRSERRRRRREAAAMDLGTLETTEAVDWGRVAPVLEEALLELPDRDREAIVLRYLDGQPFARVGASLGTSEDAARMRVDRAVEKLRGVLGRRGLTSTAAALAMALGQHGLVAAPAGLAGSIGAAVLAGAGGAAAVTTVTTVTAGGSAVAPVAAVAVAVASVETTSTTGILGLMSSTKLAWGLAGLLAMGSAGITLKTTTETRRAGARVASLEAELAASREAAEAARAAQARDAARLEEARREREQLMALRGEVGPLREAVRELEKLRAENRRLAAARGVPGQAAEKRETEEEMDRRAEEETARATGITRLNFAKAWALAFYFFAEANDGRMPTSFAEADKYFPKDNRSVLSVFDTDRFEIVYQGRLKDIEYPAKTIVLREREAFLNPSKEAQAAGRPLAKTYAFADGHSEIHGGAAEDFEAWERERMVAPAGGR